MMTLTEAIDNILGRRWTPGGRGPLAFDCLGLFLWLLRETRGIEIDDPFPREIEKIPERARRFFENFVEIPKEELPRALDLWHLIAPGPYAGNHILVIEDSRWLVHTQFGEVGRSPWRDFAEIETLKRYRLAVLADAG